MSTLKLTSEELELIKSTRAIAAEALVSEEVKKTNQNKLNAKENQIQTSERTLAMAKIRFDVMTNFVYELSGAKDNPFVQIIKTKEEKIKDSYHSFSCKKYKDIIIKLNSTSTGSKILKQFQSGEINKWEIEDEEISNLIYLVDYGVPVDLKPIVISFQVCNYVTNEEVEVEIGTGEYDKQGNYITKKMMKPCYTLSYSEKQHGRRTIQGVKVSSASRDLLACDFYKGNSHYNKQTYTKATKIVEDVNYSIGDLAARLEQKNKRERDVDYTAKKFAEYCENNKAIICSSSSNLRVTLHNKVSYILDSLCSDKQDDFVIEYENIRLPNRSDLDYEVSTKMAKKFMELISEFDFTQK